MSDAGSPTEGRRRHRESDDAIPDATTAVSETTWGSDDDPAVKQLQAWREELTEVRRAQRPAPKPQPKPQTRGPVTGRNTVPLWSMLGGPARPSSNGQPQPAEIDEAPAPRAQTLPTGRHARWDVISAQQATARPALRGLARSLDEQEAAPAPVLSPEEIKAAALATVAFPSQRIEDLPNSIVVKNLRKTFKDFVAVDDVSFEVPTGKIVALLGPNGAGKTTVVNMLCTLLKPDGGSAQVEDHDVVADAAAVRRSIMLTGQFAALDESLTGRENLVLFGRLLGLRKPAAKRRATQLLGTFSLQGAADKKVGQYSGGMRRRIDIACGLMTEPRVVFLDEPTTGLDPRSRQDVWSLVEELRESGVTVLLTTQYLEEADRLSDRIVVIDHGRVIAQGTSDELKSATGAAYCEVTPAHPAYLPRLRVKLADLLGPEAKEENGTIAVPAPDGPETLAEVIRRTEAAEIPLSDIGLRRPSLDEVFLALTDPDDDRAGQ